MSNLVLPSQGQLDTLDTQLGAVPWSTAKLHLYNNDLDPTPANVIGDFTPAIYSGYAAKSITWSPAFFDSNGVAVASSGELLFAQAGATGDSVYGVYITDAAGTGLLASGRFDGAPKNFVNNGDTLPVLLKLDINGGLLSISPVP